MRFIDTTINIGVEQPFQLLHFSDIHLTFVSDTDNERKRQLAADRHQYFANAAQNLEAVIADSRRTGALMVSTGDLIDFVSDGNLAAVKKFMDENDCFFAAGNHEFSQYVGEATEDAAYRNQSLDKVQASFKNNIRFASRMINGVNLVAIDNGYYLIEQWQLDALKNECEKGMPVILMMHVPLHTPSLCAEMLAEQQGKCAYLMGAPDDITATYVPDRRIQQRPDNITRAACEYIRTSPNIKAILAGHIHGTDWANPITDTLTQYIVGTTTARRIKVI